jgi:hypothetical protein
MDRAKKIVARAQDLAPWCKALVAAGNQYIATAAAAHQAQAQARANRRATCDRVRVETFKAYPIAARLYDVLDTAAGLGALGTAERVAEFRADLETLAAVCARPALRGVVELCKGEGHLMSTSGRHYDYGDLCAPAVDVKATLTAVAMRALEYQSRSHDGALPTVETFRQAEGWIRDSEVVRYASYFQVTETSKKAALERASEAFAAAGVRVPSDLSTLWAKRQVYLDAMKNVVDQTAGEWKITDKKCKGYACTLAKKSITKAIKGASVKAVYARDWYISRNALGVILERYQDMKVVYQVKGEPHCQVRSASAHEKYKGRGKYQKAKGTGWGFVRFQKC